MKLLITGALGNVGQSLLDVLIETGHDVKAFELRTSRNWMKSLKYQGKVDFIWGNLLNYKDVKKAVNDVEMVIHLAAIIPPLADKKPKLARAVNVEGTKNIIKAMQKIKRNRPKLLYTSSIAIYGDRRQNPIIKVNDPLIPNDEYGKQKLEAELAVRNSCLDWAVFRLSYITALGSLKMNPLMFEMPLNTHLEICDPDDVALALKNALETPSIWGKIYNIAGGKQCRTTYGEYLQNMMKLFGMGETLPENAFSTNEFHCGWMDDSTEANSLFDYQHHSLMDFYARVKRKFVALRYIVTVFRPIARKVVLGYSRYYNERKHDIHA